MAVTRNLNQATETEDRAAAPVSQGKVVPAGNATAVAKLRLPHPASAEDVYHIDKRGWQALIDVIFPNAKTVASVMLALEYCRKRKLDPFKRVVHIVPMWSSAVNDGQGGMIDTIWPGIAELRTTAFRTGNYAGIDPAEYGPQVETTFKSNKPGETDVTIVHPLWMRYTVRRILGKGSIAAFAGPKVFWLEAYATKDRYSELPNVMWRDRPEGQLDKCAEAAALRRAFPEELGNEYAAEEMEGRRADDSIGGAVVADEPAVADNRPVIEHRDEEGLPAVASDGPPLPPEDDQPEEAGPQEPQERRRSAKAASKTPGYAPAPDPEKEAEAFLKWCGETLAKARDIDDLETIYNEKIEPHREKMFPPDREELAGIYRRFEQGFAP